MVTAFGGHTAKKRKELNLTEHYEQLAITGKAPFGTDAGLMRLKRQQNQTYDDGGNMEASTTIRKMMTGNEIIVPDYQRAYSWDTPIPDKKKSVQTDTFLTDLEEYSQSGSSSQYYFGHFIFEEQESKFYVIDGQQRLTTIVIFLSALFEKLKQIRPLHEKEDVCFEDMIKRRSSLRFSTVEYDNQFYKDYVIEQTQKDCKNLPTESARRIAQAFQYFKKCLATKSEEYLVKMLDIISNAACTTHSVKNKSEAIQMFIFQNSRGKRPTNLEIVKAQFMYTVHLKGGDETDDIITEINDRFKKIYRSISSIEYRINEDDILLYSLRVHFDSLWESNSIDTINDCLAEENPIDFIRAFTQTLSSSFDHLATFFGAHEQKFFAIHSLIVLQGLAVGLPFIIKAYSYNLPMGDIENLCSAFESLILRHRVIGTKADMTSRLNDVFEEFTKDTPQIKPILDRVEELKTSTDYWSAYWNNENLLAALQGAIHPPVAKYLLWKYEIYLEGFGKKGYKPSRFDRITTPELEHIAPSTEPTKPHGYAKYDDEFRAQHLNCLGNYLLVSKSHNAAISNLPFQEKIKTYGHNNQQLELKEIGLNNKNWTRKLIQERKKRIIEAIQNML